MESKWILKHVFWLFFMIVRNTHTRKWAKNEPQNGVMYLIEISEKIEPYTFF